MARITNYELTQRLANANAELEVLRKTVLQLKTDLEIARQQTTRVADVASAINRMQRLPDPVVAARATALAQAREEAMRSGRCVKASF